MEPVELAKIWHSVYERLAAQYGVFAGGTPYDELPGNTKMLMEATAMDVLARLRTVIRATECRNIGLPMTGDVIVVRYLEGMPSGDERKKDYVAIRDYFQMSGITVRMLGVSGEMSLDKVTEEEMAVFGWYKKR